VTAESWWRLLVWQEDAVCRSYYLLIRDYQTETMRLQMMIAFCLGWDKCMKPSNIKVCFICHRAWSHL